MTELEYLFSLSLCHSTKIIQTMPYTSRKQGTGGKFSEKLFRKRGAICV